MKFNYLHPVFASVLILSLLMFSLPSNALAANGVSNNLLYRLNKKTGIKISILEFSQDSFTLKFTKNSQYIGTAQFNRTKKGHKTTFRDNKGGDFSFIVKPNSDKDKSLITFEYEKMSETINFAKFRNPTKISNAQMGKFNTIINEIKKNENISLMMDASTRLSDSKSYLAFDNLECTKEVYKCIAAAIAWVGSVAALITICGPTLGWGCVGALATHHVLGGVAATQCSWTIRVCEDKPKPVSDGIEIGFEEIIN